MACRSPSVRYRLHSACAAIGPAATSGRREPRRGTASAAVGGVAVSAEWGGVGWWGGGGVGGGEEGGVEGGGGRRRRRGGVEDPPYLEVGAGQCLPDPLQFGEHHGGGALGAAAGLSDQAADAAGVDAHGQGGLVPGGGRSGVCDGRLGGGGGTGGRGAGLAPPIRQGAARGRQGSFQPPPARG